VRLRSWLVLFLLALRLNAAPSELPLDVPLDANLREAFHELLRDAHGGCSRTEVAGFLVRLPAGTYAIVRWPEAEVTDEARWEGAWPPGTVAIVHTHPNWMPEPSRVDRATAARNHVPVYVVTSGGITSTAGRGPETVRWREERRGRLSSAMR
jgi:proteasome lid subunit RPN8/RPN11